jgi:two-component system LytT family sensor kinase
MPPPAQSLRWAGWAAVIAAGWLLLALLFTPQTYLLNQRGPIRLTWLQAFTANIGMFGLWALLTPLVISLGRRFPLEKGSLRRHLPLHAAAALLIASTHIVCLGFVNTVLLQLQQLDAYRPPAPIQALLVGYGATNVMIYWGVVAIGQALAYLRRYQDRELRLAQAELQSLKTQLQPHFLFNTLNAIAELIHVDARRADLTVTRLSDLLRLALSRGQVHEVALKEEIDFVRTYVEIQQTLLQERLAVTWRIDDETLDACVPAMVLQPLVENAVQHGIAPRARGGRIEISSQLAADRLTLVVADDGVGMGPDAGRAGGIGIANTRARLRHLYGTAQSFAIAPRPGGGVTVTLTMPRRGPAESRGSCGGD